MPKTFMATIIADRRPDPLRDTEHGAALRLRARSPVLGTDRPPLDIHRLSFGAADQGLARPEPVLRRMELEAEAERMSALARRAWRPDATVPVARRQPTGPHRWDLVLAWRAPPRRASSRL